MSPQTRPEIATHPEDPLDRHPSNAREPSRTLGFLPDRRTYGLGVPADSRARLAAFSAFIRRAIDHAKLNRGWSVEDIADAAGISANTIYLWRSGKGTSYPQGASVEAFCDALGIKPEVAFSLLWPGREDRPAEPVPLGPDEDLLILARRLTDPNVSPKEKFLIRETIRGLAARAGDSAGTSTDAPRSRDAS